MEEESFSLGGESCGEFKNNSYHVCNVCGSVLLRMHTFKSMYFLWFLGNLRLFMQVVNGPTFFNS